MSIRQFIKEIENKYSNLRDIDYIANAENIDIIYEDIPEGLANTWGDVPTISIKKDWTKRKQVETFWHEFYHLKYSSGNFIASQTHDINSNFGQEENRADKFVAMLLIKKPSRFSESVNTGFYTNDRFEKDEPLEKYEPLKKGEALEKEETDIYTLSEEYDVSPELVALRLQIDSSW